MVSCGAGRHFMVIFVTTAIVPSEPESTFVMLAGVRSPSLIIVGESMTAPSARTISQPATQSFTLPYFRAPYPGKPEQKVPPKVEAGASRGWTGSSSLEDSAAFIASSQTHPASASILPAVASTFRT